MAIEHHQRLLDNTRVFASSRSGSGVSKFDHSPLFEYTEHYKNADNQAPGYEMFVAHIPKSSPTAYG